MVLFPVFQVMHLAHVSSVIHLVICLSIAPDMQLVLHQACRFVGIVEYFFIFQIGPSSRFISRCWSINQRSITPTVLMK
ncbi:hypothetical protein, partial [Thiolapillus sp.]